MLPPVLRGRATFAGFTIVVALFAVALLAPWLASHNPALVDPASSFAAPSIAHWLGTDNLGRDVLSRLVYGARWSLGIVVVATALIMSVGVAVGVVAGYAGGVLDDVLMRLVDTLLSVPSLLLGLAIVGTLGPGIGSMTGERASSQASTSCATVTPCRVAARLSFAMASERPAPSGNQGMNAMPWRSHAARTSS